MRQPLKLGRKIDQHAPGISAAAPINKIPNFVSQCTMPLLRFMAGNLKRSGVEALHVLVW